jgi:transcriptional regulator with XRE-family HTH domain
LLKYFIKRNILAEENLVKKTCRELGITQKELAEKIGITEKTISSWVNSKTKIPKNFLRMSELLKIENSYKEILQALSKTNNLQLTI